MTEHFRIHGRAAARRAPGQGQRRNGAVAVTRVPDDAMALALVLADGDARRLRVLSSSAVLVLNRPRPGTRMPKTLG